MLRRNARGPREGVVGQFESYQTIFLQFSLWLASGSWHTLAMATYRILYQVESSEADGGIRVSPGYATEAEAQARIDDLKRMARVADREEGNLPRNWRDGR
jgi:hypothetical protein